MSSQEAAHASSKEVTPNWSKGTLDLGGSIDSAVVGLRAGDKPTYVMERSCG